MAPPPLAALLAPGAKARNLDLQALLAIAQHEGASGRIGDNGHAFGAFQLNDAGGVLTGKFPNMTPAQKNAWAWSPAGIRYALDGIARVAAGQRGAQAIRSIASRFERPANVGAEISDALSHYGTGAGIPVPQVSPGAAARAPQAPGGSPLLGQLLSQTNEMVGLGANPTLAGLLSGAAPSAPGQPPGAPGGTARAGALAGGFLPAGAMYKSGRIDAGHDFQTNPGGAIVAPGNGVVVGVKSDPGGFGPSYPVVHFTSGPYAGRTIYVGHTLATVKPGQQVRAGQTISRTGTSGVGNATVGGWGEIGYAPGGVPGRTGQAPPFR